MSFDDQTGGAGVSATGISIDDGTRYLIESATGGTGITLGSGGIAAVPSTSGQGYPEIAAQLTLNAAQTWTIGYSPRGGQKLVLGPVSGGSNDTVSIRFTGGARDLQPALELADNVEVGAVAANGYGHIDLVGSPFALNSADGNPVRLGDHAELIADFPGSSTGPLTSTGGAIQVGQGAKPDGTLAVRGTLTLDSKTFLVMYVNRKGSKPSKDFSQLRASGNVTLGGAHLSLQAGSGISGCPTLRRGDVIRLITTAGTITGKFAGLRKGGIYGLICQGTNPRARIRYTAHAVTATVVRK